MKKLNLLLFALACMAAHGYAQFGNTITIQGTGAPSGTCSAIMRYVNLSDGVTYSCTGAGAWVLTGAAGEITGALTATRVPFASSATVLTDDADMTFTGGNTLNIAKVAVGTTSPSANLEVLGGVAAGLNDAMWLSGGAAARGSGPALLFHEYFANNAVPTWQLSRIGSVYSASSSYGGDITFETNTGTSATDLSEKARLLYNGNFGIGTSAPTALLHFKAGTATASTAPLKFTSGTLLGTPEAGAVEFLGDAYYATISTGAARKTFSFLESPALQSPTATTINIGTGTTITKHLSATATLDFASLVAIGCEDLTITVTGAALGDTVSIGVPNASVVANTSYSGWVSSTSTVSVRFCALISGDPASGTFRADVWQH